MTTKAAIAVLVIDDEVQILRLLRHALEADGYEVHEANTGKHALGEVACLQPQVILLDLGLPDLDGIEVLRRLREWSQVPVLILTVRNSENDVIAALNAGADDYLTKPFRARELLARLRAILRRTRTASDTPVVRFGEIEVDLAGHLVRKSGVDLHLSAKEYAVLRILVLNQGRVVTHRQILREVWGPNAELNTHYLRAYMAHLRNKLEVNARAPAYLKTESGIGYRLLED